MLSTKTSGLILLLKAMDETFYKGAHEIKSSIMEKYEFQMRGIP